MNRGVVDWSPETNVATRYQQVFELVMAGQEEDEIVRRFQELPSDERQAMLCILWHIRKEIADTSQEHGRIVSRLLAFCTQCDDAGRMCPFKRIEP
jgi:hypothetical protein